jgi:hypothetical protein
MIAGILYHIFPPLCPQIALPTLKFLELHPLRQAVVVSPSATLRTGLSNHQDTYCSRWICNSPPLVHRNSQLPLPTFLLGEGLREATNHPSLVSYRSPPPFTMQDLSESAVRPWGHLCHTTGVVCSLRLHMRSEAPPGAEALTHCCKSNGAYLLAKRASPVPMENPMLAADNNPRLVLCRPSKISALFDFHALDFGHELGLTLGAMLGSPGIRALALYTVCHPHVPPTHDAREFIPRRRLCRDTHGPSRPRRRPP